MIVYAGSFLIWALFVVVVVALLVERDVSTVQHLVSQHTEPLAEQVNRVREEHDSLIEDMRSQVEDLESRTRATFERLDVNLLPTSVHLRAGFTFGVSEVSVTLSQSGGSRWGRFWRRVPAWSAQGMGSGVWQTKRGLV